MVKSLPQMHVQTWTTLELPPSYPVSGGCPVALHRCRLSPVLRQPWQAQGWPQVWSRAVCVSPCWHRVGLQGSGGVSSAAAAAAEAMPRLRQVCQDRMTPQKWFDQSWAKRVYSSHTSCCEALSLVPGNRKTCHGKKGGGQCPSLCRYWGGRSPLLGTPQYFN